VLKDKEGPVAEEVPTETLFGDHREIAVDVEIAKIASENLTMSEGEDAMEVIASMTHDKKKKWRCDFDCVLLRDVTYWSGGYFVDLVNF
jgi:hypothetical protein